MPGFPLAAIGAGLGEWARNAQQQQLLQQNQQDQQLRRQLQMMQLRELLQSRESQRTAADAAAGFLTGGSGIGPVNPMAGGAGGGVGVPMSQAAPAALGFDAALNAPSSPQPRPPLPPGFGGAVRSAGDVWLQQNAPVPTQGRTGPQPEMNASKLPWTNSTPGPEAYAQASGPGAPTGGPSPSPNTTGMRMSPDNTNAPPVGPTQAAGIGAPPPEYDPATTAAAIKRAHPNISNQDLVAAVELVGKELGPKVKGAYDRWKTRADLYYKERSANVAEGSLAETKEDHQRRFGLETNKFNFEKEDKTLARGLEDRRTTTGEGQLAETKEDHQRRFGLDTDKFSFEKEDKTLARGLEGRRATTGEGQLAETVRQHDRTLDAKARAAQGKSDAATTEMKTLASRARDLYAAVEQNPNLVGVRGRGARVFGGVAEQAKIKKEDEAAAAFLSELNILKAGLQASKFQGARYFSKGAMDQLSALVPGEGAMDNPTKVKSALRALADRLDEKATEVGATATGVGADYKSMSDEELLRSIGITPGQQ